MRTTEKKQTTERLLPDLHKGVQGVRMSWEMRTKDKGRCPEGYPTETGVIIGVKLGMVKRISKNISYYKYIKIVDGMERVRRLY